MSRLIAMLVIVIGLLFFAIGWAIGVSFWEDFIFAIGIIVAMVPEGLLPTLTLALVLATQRMAKRNVLIRYLPSVEALGSTTVICTDKTGTLTQNRMTVKQVFLGETLESMADLVQKGSFLERYRLWPRSEDCQLTGDKSRRNWMPTGKCSAVNPTCPGQSSFNFP